MRRTRASIGLLFGAGFFATTGQALAAPGLFQPTSGKGVYHADGGAPGNTSNGSSFQAADGSFFWHITCVGSDPNEPCASDPNLPPPTNWHQLPTFGSAASAQARTPNFGVIQVRTWTSGINGVGTGAPGYTEYYSRAHSEWREEITTTSATPVVLTFIFALQVDWNDGGLWALQMGRPGGFDPDLGYAPMFDGRTWSNCNVNPFSGLCAFDYDTGNAPTILPGGGDGSVRTVVSHTFTVHPESFFDPEDPGPHTNPFSVALGARSHANDAEVLAYPGARLLAIHAPPGANLTFASGHSYNIVVPEPGAAASLASGLALLGLLGLRRSCGREAGSD